MKIDINSTDGYGVLYYAKNDETREALIKLGASNRNYYNEEEDY